MHSKLSFALAYQLIANDLRKLCEYIDPHDDNRMCYSHRTYELFLRTCTELENLWKCILRSNNYVINDKKGRPKDSRHWKIDDYVKVQLIYFIELSRAEVIFVPWRPQTAPIIPYKDWVSRSKSGSSPLEWYADYNAVKHDREVNFAKASLNNLIHAVGALHVTLLAYFGTGVFTPQPLPPNLAQTGLYETFLLFKVVRGTVNIPSVS